METANHLPPQLVGWSFDQRDQGVKRETRTPIGFSTQDKEYAFPCLLCTPFRKHPPFASSPLAHPIPQCGNVPVVRRPARRCPDASCDITRRVFHLNPVPLAPTLTPNGSPSQRSINQLFPGTLKTLRAPALSVRPLSPCIHRNQLMLICRFS